MNQYLQITIIGIGIVFLALAMLFLIFNVLGRIFSRENHKEIKLKELAPVTKANSSNQDSGSVDLEEIAAINAAVFATLGHSDFSIRSVELLQTTRVSAWKRRNPTIYWKVRRGKH